MVRLGQKLTASILQVKKNTFLLQSGWFLLRRNLLAAAPCVILHATFPGYRFQAPKFIGPRALMLPCPERTSPVHARFRCGTVLPARTRRLRRRIHSLTTPYSWNLETYFPGQTGTPYCAKLYRASIFPFHFFFFRSHPRLAACVRKKYDVRRGSSTPRHHLNCGAHFFPIHLYSHAKMHFLLSVMHPRTARR